MVKKPTADIEDYDDLGAYISDAMAEGYTIEAEDFEGRPCSYCGETIPFADWPDGVVTWDIRVMEPDADEPDPYVARRYFCSEGCRSDAMRDPEWVKNGGHGEADHIHIDDVEGNV